jgi:hypothetical protein
MAPGSNEVRESFNRSSTKRSNTQTVMLTAKPAGQARSYRILPRRTRTPSDVTLQEHMDQHPLALVELWLLPFQVPACTIDGRATPRR